MAYGISTLYTIIIVILIVLQWFRVGTPSVAAGIIAPEGNLVTNGGLFIITMFMLVACSCRDEYRVCKHKGRY